MPKDRPVLWRASFGGFRCTLARGCGAFGGDRGWGHGFARTEIPGGAGWRFGFVGSSARKEMLIGLAFNEGQFSTY
jgi:hypothetical protein